MDLLQVDSLVHCHQIYLSFSEARGKRELREGKKGMRADEEDIGTRKRTYIMV